MESESYVILPGQAELPTLFMCEHASGAVPAPYGSLGLRSVDLQTHWATDLHALDVLLLVHEMSRCPAIHARYTRLLVDLNREPTSAELICTRIGTGTPSDPQRPVRSNTSLDHAERLRRLRRYYRPYHNAVTELGDELVSRHGRSAVLVSLHSFSPDYHSEQDPALVEETHADSVLAGQISEGTRADVDVGILFDDDGENALRMRAAFERCRLRVGLNAPYSAQKGAGFSPRMHAITFGCDYLQVELNQKTVRDRVVRRQIATILAEFAVK